MKSPIFDTAVTKKTIPSVGKFAYYVFSIDIPFKGSQNHSNMRSNVTVVSYFHSGVNDSAVHVTAVSMTPLCHVQPNHIPA
jgi:hypothetical protein